LTSDEMLQGAVIAAQHKITSDRRRREGAASRRPEHYEEDRTWDQEIESTLAEIAVARWRNRYWSGSMFTGDSGSDVGDCQVRWTGYTRGHLVVYTEDNPAAPFVLVTGRSPSMNIIGWMPGVEARQDRFWREDVKCPSWWVPQDAEELRKVFPKAVYNGHPA
jgi:hypothetical protein